MKFTHSDIEEMVADLPAWVEGRKNPRFVRTGFRGATKLAIYSYHRDEDIERSQRYLDDVMTRLKLINAARREEAEQTLAAYTDWWGGAGITATQFRLRLKWALADDMILGGEISRIDVGNGLVDYQGILLGIR